MKPWGKCRQCGAVLQSHLDFMQHLDSHAGVERPPDWYFSRSRQGRPAQWDDATAPLVFVNQKTGEVRYPGRHDAVPPAGYARQHLRSLREVERFEREHGVRSEMAWFDPGSGRGFDDTIFGKKETH